MCRRCFPRGSSRTPQWTFPSHGLDRHRQSCKCRCKLRGWQWHICIIARMRRKKCPVLSIQPSYGRHSPNNYRVEPTPIFKTLQQSVFPYFREAKAQFKTTMWYSSLMRRHFVSASGWSSSKYLLKPCTFFMFPNYFQANSSLHFNFSASKCRIKCEKVLSCSCLPMVHR